MGMVQALAIMLALMSTMLTLSALACGLEAVNRTSEATAWGFLTLASAVMAGCCLLGSVILTAIQPFLPSQDIKHGRAEPDAERGRSAGEDRPRREPPTGRPRPGDRLGPAGA